MGIQCTHKRCMLMLHIWPVKVVFIILYSILNTSCMQEIQLSEADNGKKIQLKMDDHVVIKLPSSPGTGYTWEVQANSHFSVSHEYQMQPDEAVGAAGIDI